MRYSMLIVGALSATVATGTVAKDKDSGKPVETPQMFQEMVACETVESADDRLACFDRTIKRLAMAVSMRDIVVAERETIKDAERGLFGLSLPRMKLFGGGNDDQIKEIESTISSFRRDENGALIFTVADGARWRQIDSQPQFVKAGDKVKIRKAALGSFFAKIAGRSGFKVSRVAN